MSAKVILVLCAQAFFIQTAFSSCLGRGAIAAPKLIAPGCAGKWANQGLIGDAVIGDVWAGKGLAALEIMPTSGGGFPVSSFSAIAPSGLSIASENSFEGALSVAGELPFVSAVALDAVLPSAGAGAVSYSCGKGATAIKSIAPSAAAYDAAGARGAAGAYGLGAGCGRGTAAIAPAALGLGYGSRGCGCGCH
ncbi:hypothetical protein PYW08_011323 [Mythimna loreyi]|uniref:Uncharacterized protein n=1 Tax=Mythimna loreyi TaxID=667449 RepID=A0ACC2Q4X1_9NEOP|nr:hypothetical protein PYW08_011323 [Mythimna loreyi]